ncbi:hypothetical protein [Bradyrhizobium sp. 192]|uniref:hypothetical protein n=1 Tax=Bradyrhizobium sp. 192 TaxID=2782660 RepID=UPI001FFF82FD|nr:hypothetical protein [Bradyrhizobium sp. 192]
MPDYSYSKTGLDDEDYIMARLDTENEERREFLKSCGKFAAVTPPAMVLLLSTSLTSTAIASSGGRSVQGNNGKGNGGYDGSPNGKEDNTR